MKPFEELCSIPAYITGKNIDTDQIIPARFLKLARGEDLANALFHDLRFTEQNEIIEDFVLNQQPFKESSILVVDDNFGCGSSREAAVYALVEFGIKVVIAPSLGDIFHNNCLKNGLLPIVLEEQDFDLIRELMADNEKLYLCVSLEKQLISVEKQSSKGQQITVPFKVESFWRDCLLKGFDDLALTLSRMDEVLAFEKKYQQSYPWQLINALN